MVEEKKIALFGDSKQCEEFFLLFRNTLNIKYILYLEGIVEEKDKTDYNVSFLRFNSKIVLENNLFIILCVEFKNRKDYDVLLYKNELFYKENYVDSLQVLQFYRKKMTTSLYNKNIWIFGAGDNGKKFYQDYKEDLSIHGFVSNFENEKNVYGLPVIRPLQLKNKKDSYVVICSDAREIMIKQLDEIGLEIITEYCTADFLPKDLFVAIGTCQISDVLSVLQKNIKFALKYESCCFFESPYSTLSYSDKIRVMNYGKFCDVVFWGKSVKGFSDQVSYEHTIEKYYPDAMKLCLPFYYFDGQLMQATDSVNPYTVTLPCSQITYWFRGDKVINDLVEQGLSKEEIIDRISSDTYWSENEIIKNFNKELKRIDILDRFSSIPIKQFIIDNYRSVPIFKDGTHFGLELCLHIANEIAKRINIIPINNNEKVINQIDDVEKGFMPVYPCVAKALNLKFGFPGSKFAFANIMERKVEFLDFREYEIRYIEYVTMIREISLNIGTYWS